MKKLFLVDAYALIYKYYYAFLTRPMRNRTGMNTSVVFGFVKFLRDILKRENPDLLGVAFDPKGGSFRRELYPEYKANRPATPEDIALSIPYIKRILDAMCVPVLEVEGFEADDVIGTLSQKAAAEGYEVFMVTPDKDYGQLVRPCCKLYKQKGDGIEIVDCDAIRAHYGFDDPDARARRAGVWGDASDNIPGVPGIGEKGACKLVQTWGTVENILSNVERIKGRQGESIAAWGDKLLLAKRLTTIRLDVPIEFRPEELTMCPPNLDELRALFAELDFTMFLRDLQNVAPLEESDGPRQDPQRQLAEMARAKSAAAKKAALVGQGDLFAPADPAPAAAAPVEDDEEVDETDALPAEPEMESAQTTPHDYRIVRTADELRAMIAEIRRYPEFCFDTETTGFDLFNDRIVGMSFAVVPHEAWYVPCDERSTPEYAGLLRPLFEDETIAKIGQNIKFDLMVLRRIGLAVRGPKYDTMILHYLLDPESRHNMNALAAKYLNYKPIEIETLIGRGPRQLTMDLVGVERVAEYAAEDADVTLRLKRALLPQIEEAGLHDLYFGDRGADDRGAGRRRDGRRAHRLRRAGALRRGTEPPHGAARSRHPQRSGRGVAQHQLHTAVGRGAFRQNAHRREAQDDAHEAVQHRRRVSANIRAQTPDRRSDPRIPRREEAPFDLRRGTAAAGQPPHGKDPYLVQSGRDGYRTVVVDQSQLAEHSDPRRAGQAHSPRLHPVGRRPCAAVGRLQSGRVAPDGAYERRRGAARAFEHGEDIHAATAARLFGKPIDTVTGDERRKAKTANFGIIYGISAFGLSQRLDIPRKEAKEIIEGYFASYPKVKEYMEHVVERAREVGYVTTIFGTAALPERHRVAQCRGARAGRTQCRQRPYSGQCGRHHEDRHGAYRRSVPPRRNPLADDFAGARRSGDRHAAQRLDRVREIVTEAMEQAAHLKVKLIAECGVGENWLDAH